MARHSRDGVDEVTDGPDGTGADELDSSPTADELGASGAPKHSFFVRLYTGTGAFDVVGKRKLWYGISGAIMVIAIASISLLWFNFGIDFKGGTKVAMPATGAQGQVTTQQVEDVFSKTLGKGPESVVQVGNGGSATIQIRTEKLSNPDNDKLRTALFDAFQPKGPNGQLSKDEVSSSDVSSTWGGQITQKAIIALVVFLALVSVYIAVRYERYMAAAALAALIFDIVTTAGVYSLVGFEVTPATVIGLLTILGFSLYDTVIVFDKVEENVHGFEHTTRRTFAEQANLAINQTFMRSINTSLISVLPILALIVIAVWLLGVGTLQDLALVQLVGVIVGTYSSIFFATPLLVSMRERTELVRTHTRRVNNRRKGSAGRNPAADAADAADGAGIDATELGRGAEPETVSVASSSRPSAPAPEKPAPGAKPNRPTGRPSGKRNTRR